jgi:hypothetical protein
MTSNKGISSLCRDELDANLLAAKIAAEGHKGPRCRRYVSQAKPPFVTLFLLFGATRGRVASVTQNVKRYTALTKNKGERCV